ncbi:MAG: SdiA-regulated domain-containing protein [Chitinophagaceae bacterium]|nr:SdiA-regulated domain-containing protein [Chitinophagaceae bacterium]
MKPTNGMPQVTLFNKLDKIVFMILGLVVLIAVSWKIMGNRSATTPSSDVTIVQKWDMPAELKEISALCNIGENQFACVQDEVGIIYVYNTADKKIENKIKFAETGDFEGVAFTGDHYYVVRADGLLFETPLDENPDNTKEYKTSLTVKHNVEGLCYDRENNRLLLAIKDEEPNNPGYKGIYAFDLRKKVFIEEPVFKIDLRHSLFDQSKKKKVMPSAITIHPKTKEIFITDGPQSRLLIMDEAGKPKHFIELGKKFAQPEGITFDHDGNLFISNEGTKQPGNILQVKLQ